MYVDALNTMLHLLLIAIPMHLVLELVTLLRASDPVAICFFLGLPVRH